MYVCAVGIYAREGIFEEQGNNTKNGRDVYAGKGDRKEV